MKTFMYQNRKQEYIPPSDQTPLRLRPDTHPDQHPPPSDHRHPPTASHQIPRPLRGQTDSCENITFPASLRYAVGNNMLENVTNVAFATALV